MHETDAPAFGTTEFQLPYGQWVRVLTAAGFTLDRLENCRPDGCEHSVATR